MNVGEQVITANPTKVIASDTGEFLVIDSQGHVDRCFNSGGQSLFFQEDGRSEDNTVPYGLFLVMKVSENGYSSESKKNKGMTPLPKDGSGSPPK